MKMSRKKKSFDKLDSRCFVEHLKVRNRAWPSTECTLTLSNIFVHLKVSFVFVGRNKGRKEGSRGRKERKDQQGVVEWLMSPCAAKKTSDNNFD